MSLLATAGKFLASDQGANLVDSASGLFGMFNRPSIPKPMTANQMKERMDIMYPGTTPWERLGSQGGGVPQSSATQHAAKMQAKVQQQAHKNQLQITKLNNDTQRDVAEINATAKRDTSVFGKVSQGEDDYLDFQKEKEVTAKDYIDNFNKGDHGKNVFNLFKWIMDNYSPPKPKEPTSIPSKITIKKGEKRKYTPRAGSPAHSTKKTGRSKK
jgi:hypothetical protein